VRSASRDSRPLVLIYQMGKVGSSTIQASLKTVRGINCFQIHRLNPNVSERMVSELGITNEPALRRLQQSRAIYEEVIQRRRPAKIISLVREPIGRNISAYFENLDLFWKTENAYQRLTLDQLIEGFFERYPHTLPLTWFDEEFKEVLGLDVYERSFPAQARFVEFASGPYEVLILRTDLDDIRKAECLRQFLGIDRLKWIQKNVSADARYSSVYNTFKKAIQMPRDYVGQMLDSKFTRHFFSDVEIDAFGRQWLRQAKP
jgi:hypothetical protein